MTIPAASQIHPLNMPMAKIQFVYGDKDPRATMLTDVARQLLQQAIEFVSGTARVIPVSITGTNDLTLTLNPSGPQIGLLGGNTTGYYDYDVFSGVAAATSTGAVTAHVVTASRPNAGGRALGTLKVYINNGGTQAGAGDLTIGRHYTFTFVDSLDGGSGGFVLR